MAVTWASRITAFLGSVTRPVTDALVDCACSTPESRAHIITARITLRIEILMYSHPSGFRCYGQYLSSPPATRRQKFLYTARYENLYQTEKIFLHIFRPRFCLEKRLTAGVCCAKHLISFGLPSTCLWADLPRR